MREVDVVVIGAGIVGASLCARVGGQARRTRLVGPGPRAGRRPLRGQHRSLVRRGPGPVGRPAQHLARLDRHPGLPLVPGADGGRRRLPRRRLPAARARGGVGEPPRGRRAPTIPGSPGRDRRPRSGRRRHALPDRRPRRGDRSAPPTAPSIRSGRPTSSSRAPATSVRSSSSAPESTRSSVATTGRGRSRRPRGRVATRWVVNAAGGWSGDVAALAGLGVPVAHSRRNVFATGALPFRVPMTLDVGTGVFLRSEGDRVIFGLARPGEPAGYDVAVDWPWLEGVLAAAVPRFPWLADAPLDRRAVLGGHLRGDPRRPARHRADAGRRRRGSTPAASPATA